MTAGRNSEEFAREAACVMAANGIPVYIFDEMAPVSLLSFAVKRLGASLGLMITASHNSREYNGYKVYSSDGYQITDEASEAILAECQALDTFEDVSYMDFEDAFKWSICTYVDNDICEDLSGVYWHSDLRTYQAAISESYIRRFTAQDINMSKLYSKERVSRIYI